MATASVEAPHLIKEPESAIPIGNGHVSMDINVDGLKVVRTVDCRTKVRKTMHRIYFSFITSQDIHDVFYKRRDMRCGWDMDVNGHGNGYTIEYKGMKFWLQSIMNGDKGEERHVLESYAESRNTVAEQNDLEMIVFLGKLLLPRQQQKKDAHRRREKLIRRELPYFV